jgi:hypothetical protein
MKELTPDPWNTTSGGSEHSIGHIAGSPRAGKWNAWVMEQDSVWIDIDNNVFLIDDISSRYAFNILRFLWRNGRVNGPPYENPLIMALFRRLRNGQTLSEVLMSLGRRGPDDDREDFEIWEDLERYHHPQDLIGDGR